jgi:glycosyltransferase involved in cell wall biosynthesis
MKIFLINHYAGSPRHGMEYRPFFMAREWVRQGHQVMIVASSFAHLRTAQPNLTGRQLSESIEGIRYLWLRTPRYEGNGAGRVVNMLAFVVQLLSVALRLRRPYKPDVVLASSTYPLDIFPAFLLARRAKAKLIFEVHDLWPLSVMELGRFSRFHPFIVAMQIAEDFAYRYSDTVVSILPCAKPYMISRGLKEHKFVHVPNGVVVSEEEHAGLSPQTLYVPALRNLRGIGRFVILYAGAHGVANALDSFIDTAALLRDQPVTFVLVGQGPEKQRLCNKCRSLHLSNVEFLSNVARSNIMSVLREADALYLSLQRNPLFRFGVSPNKLFDYMMAGRPIIQAIDAGNDIVRESGCGLTITPEDPQALSAAIGSLMAMGESERRRLGANGKRYVMDHHDYRKLAELFPLTPNLLEQVTISR